MSNDEELQLLKQKLAEKEQNITDLEKKIRLNEFRQKKAHSEMTLTIDAEKMKVQNAQEQMQRLNTQITELENKLSEQEQKTLQLIDENTQLKKVRRHSDTSDEESKDLAEKLLPRKSIIQKMGNISELPSYNDLLEMIQKYDGNKQEMISEMEKYQETTQEALSNRDTQIYQLQEEIRQMQDSLTESDKKNQELSKQIALLEENIQQYNQQILIQKQQLESIKYEKEQQQNEFLSKLKEMSEQKDSIDNIVQDTEQRYQKLMMLQEEQYQNREQELLNQLQENEEKIQENDQQIQQIENKWKNELKEKDEEIRNINQKRQEQIQQLQKQLIDETKKLKDDHYKQIIEMKNENQSKIEQLEQNMLELKSQLEGETKKIKKLEILKKRKEQDIEELQENIKQLEEELSNLKNKSNEMIDSYENKIRDMQQKNIQMEQRQSIIYDPRQSVSSTEHNRNFEIEVLKAQIEHLKQKGDIELQAEITRLNERERQLKKELLDLQNDAGTERLNFTLRTKQLEQEVESLNSEVQHAQSEQTYAEQTAAKLSVQYANLAMEYETTVLQNRNYRKELQKLRTDLTSLIIQDQDTLKNHTDQFKSQLQLDAYQENSGQSQSQSGNEESRMKQILSEQEERLGQRIAQRKIISAKKRNEDGEEEFSEEDLDDQAQLRAKSITPTTSADIPRKQLQEHMMKGVDVEKIEDVVNIAFAHKVSITVLIILVLSVFVLMREFYKKKLHKIFRQAISKIAYEQLQLQIIILGCIAIYYTNYFDTFFLIKQTQSKYIRKDILLIDAQDYKEDYRLNLYSYFLLFGLYTVINIFIVIYNAFYLNGLMNKWKLLEDQWDERYKLASLYIQQSEELKEKQERFEQIVQLGGGENEEIKEQIKGMKEIMEQLDEKLAYFLKKAQFIQRIIPYFGPNFINENIYYWEYLGRSCANTFIQINSFSIIPIIFVFLTILLIQIQAYIIGIFWTEIIVAFILFYFIIDLNYRTTILFDQSFIKKQYELLTHQELQEYPKFLDMVYEQQLPSKPVDPQTAIFPFMYSNYFIYFLNYIYKQSSILVITSQIYVFYWYTDYQWYLKTILIIIDLLIWFANLYVSQNIIIQYVFATSVFKKDFQIIYSVARSQKLELYLASHKLLELAKFIHRTYIQNELVKENLLLYRPVIDDIIMACQYYQSKQQQQSFDQREQTLLSLGFPLINLFHKAYLTKILDSLGTPYTKQDLAFIEYFCLESDVDNSNYLSPTKLVLYLHLRNQEIELKPNELLNQFFLHTQHQNYEEVEGFEGENEEEYKQSQIENGQVNIDELQNFLIQCQLNGYLTKNDVKVLISNFKLLNSYSINRLSDFICNQVPQMPI